MLKNTTKYTDKPTGSALSTINCTPLSAKPTNSTLHI